MCGIAGIIKKDNSSLNLSEKVVHCCNALAHRGPDGEGFMLLGKAGASAHYHILKQKHSRFDLKYTPQVSISNAPTDSFLAFGHRRLSIIDLSETGHQPMCTPDAKLWITYNGEVYNYIEIREELKNLGYHFISESDTEVILLAYKHWGFNCVDKFNGMWAFCIYDEEKNLCFASRDRLGVKPFYYINNTQFFAFASEQKAFIKSGLISANVNQKALHNYLVNGLLETETANFFDGINELWPGNNLIYHIQTKVLETKVYYHLSDHINLENDHLTEKKLVEKISDTLENAVRLRLRSDVEVGTCLSGGIDSSALATIISDFTQQPLNCFTAVFKNQLFNEESFADIVIKQISGKSFKTQPSLNGFEREFDDLIYSQDVPIWDSSTYAQYKVMELAKENNIKVVLDGQGADELFGGYHHHFVAQWNNLFSNTKLISAIKSISASGKSIPNPFLFYTIEHLKYRKHFNKKNLSFFFKSEFLNSQEIKNPFQYFNDVNQQLLSDIYDTRLKTFLKCEDRCGMWHSVESRTPFSDDINLINLLFSFNGNKKIKNGVSKYLLREAVKNKLPPEIYSRYDKKGFETPMHEWMQKLRPKLLAEVKSANFDFVNYSNLEKTNPDNIAHNKLLFKLFVFIRWQKLFGAQMH